MARSWGGRGVEEGMLCAMVLKSTAGKKKTDGSLGAKVLKSIAGRQYNGKRNREERQARPDEIKDQS
jgi:hypothetical protein